MTGRPHMRASSSLIWGEIRMREGASLWGRNLMTTLWGCDMRFAMRAALIPRYEAAMTNATLVDLRIRVRPTRSRSWSRGGLRSPRWHCHWHCSGRAGSAQAVAAWALQEGHRDVISGLQPAGHGPAAVPQHGRLAWPPSMAAQHGRQAASRAPARGPRDGTRTDSRSRKRGCDGGQVTLKASSLPRAEGGRRRRLWQPQEYYDSW